jgi:hypothetical protein
MISRVPSADETWYDLPAQVEEPFQVYMNGIPQQPGVDYQLVGSALVFPRILEPDAKPNRTPWLLGALGILRTHTPQQTVDIAYHRDGQPQVATGLRPRDVPAEPPPVPARSRP